MTTFSQASRPVALRTPLGDDAALLTRLHGSEGVSDLFHFTLDLLAEQPLPFDKLLGQPASVRLDVPGCPRRWINGVVVSLEEGHTVQGPQGGATFIRYQAELSPALWLLGQRKQSRVFQDRTVPDIVSSILKDEWEIDVEPRLTGIYPERTYCVQFRETDLAFVRRLLEEEGISFFFLHEESSHTLILADHPDAYPKLGDTLLFDAATGGRRPEGRVTAWRKKQSLRATRYMVRDHCFQIPNSNLDSMTHTLDRVQVGQVTHQLAIDPKQRSEVYEHPGGYGWRFDGVGVSGKNQPDNVQNLFKDNERIAHLRMQEEASHTVVVRGESLCGHLFAGCKFDLGRHRDGDGGYLLTRIEHRADLEEAYLTGSETERLYDNRFEASPAALPFRPPRVTPRPTIHGSQTAVVVGPPGSDLFVDKYGRVKVKFFWDRDPRTGPENSCWLRVAQVWAGNRWGAYFWPRVGHEVAVIFSEGNPDRPSIIGSFYNENNMPPFELPDNRMLGGIKSFTSTGDVNAPADPLANFNGIVFNDDKSKEQIEIHGERHVAFFGEHSHEHSIDGWHHLNVNGVHRLNVGALPFGSGSGGGADKPPPFVHSGAFGSGDIGVSVSSVTGLAQTIVLGGQVNLAVGERLNIIMNPIGLATDLVTGIPESLGPMSKFLSAASGLFSFLQGEIDLYMGTRALVVYGRNNNLCCSTLTSVNSNLAWRGHTDKVTVALPWVLVAEVLAEVITLYTMSVTIAGASKAYKREEILFDSLIWVGEALAELLTGVHLLVSTLLHIEKALKETGPAAIIVENKKVLNDTSDSVEKLGIESKENNDDEQPSSSNTTNVPVDNTNI